MSNDANTSGTEATPAGSNISEPEIESTDNDTDSGAVNGSSITVESGSTSMAVPIAGTQSREPVRTGLVARPGQVQTRPDNSTNGNNGLNTTTSTTTVDFGQSFQLGDPKNGVSPMLNPFPVRADGTRYDSALGSSLGADTVIGSAFTAENPNRVPARVQRWRASVQRALSRNISVDVAYNGTFADHNDISIRQDYLPEQWYNGSNVRDLTQQNLLNANVPNPYFIGNFASLKTTNAALYNRMAGNSFFTSATVQRNRLLRPFSQINNLTFSNLPLGKTRASSVEVGVNRRFADGFSLSATYVGARTEELTTVEEYDRVPGLWQSSQNSRPHRIVSNGVLEIPFGRNKPFLNDGGILGGIFGGWQLGATYEYQPGALLQWTNNLFFDGDLDNIAVKDPTLDRWFNVDAGFERDPGKVPASFQKRAFPFRIDGVRGPGMMLLNTSFTRNVQLPSRKQLQLRLDMLNALNREHYDDPVVNPTSAQFGMVTAASGTSNRLVTFITKLTF